MTKIISKFGIGRACLISFILLCSVFMSENAFSGRKWKQSNIKSQYYCSNNTIGIEFLCYEDNPADAEVHYLDYCEFSYSKAGSKQITPLMTACVNDCLIMNKATILMSNKKQGETIIIYSSESNYKRIQTEWIDGKQLRIEHKIQDHRECITGHLVVEWYLNNSNLLVNSIHVNGRWCTKGKSACETFSGDYPVRDFKLKSNVMDDCSILMPVISTQVKVTGETDAINVTGAEPGKEIKVYTVSGVEVKSVVATDDVVNIKLPTNQIYIVKAGPERCKVAL